MKKILLALLVAVTTLMAADVTFTWTPNPTSELVSTYVIEYKKLPGVTNWTVLTSVPGSTNKAVVTGIQPAYQYYFRAFAVNAVGKGTNQSTVIPVPSSIPNAVTNFTGNAN